jgi:hypothetical protein
MSINYAQARTRCIQAPRDSGNGNCKGQRALKGTEASGLYVFCARAWVRMHMHEKHDTGNVNCHIATGAGLEAALVSYKGKQKKQEEGARSAGPLSALGVGV